MAENSEEREVICPDIKNLISVETNISCPLNGCSKILPSTSALRMHLVKRHKIREDGYEVFERKKSCQKVWKKKSVYCCPVAACIRGRNSGKYFNRLAHVKQVFELYINNVIIFSLRNNIASNCGVYINVMKDRKGK